MPRSSSRQLPNLPAGFRFHPTDEELIVHYLMNQASSLPCPVPIIAEVNIYHCNPWDLPAKALFGENEWYFFSPRDRKYPNGARPNRAAGSGYWKATGTDKAILSTPTSENIGVKKALVFYGGKPPKGVKTDWIMHEYRLTGSANNKRTKRIGGSSMRLDDWVLCRIYKKSNNFQFSDQEQEGSTVEEEVSLNNNNLNNNGTSEASPKSGANDHDHFYPMTISKSFSITDLLNTIDCSALSELLDDPAEAETTPLIYPMTTQTHQSFNYSNNVNNTHFNLPQPAEACSDYVASNCNGLKRKRVMSMDDSADESFDDGSSNFSAKLKLPSDSRSSLHSQFVGSMSSYCNQQQLCGHQWVSVQHPADELPIPPDAVVAPRRSWHEFSYTTEIPLGGTEVPKTELMGDGAI